MVGKLKQCINSRWMLRASIGLFVVQAVFLSFAVPYKSPSDEEYHFRLTDIYSQRSVWAGPVVADQTDNFNLGDIQRTPGYMYHYLMSFILRAIKPLVTTIDGQVIVLRLVNVALGVWAILLFVHLLKRIGARGLVVNLTVAWLALTTMFIWVFAALSYDNLAFVLFFGLLHLLLGLYARPTARSALLILAISLGLMLTKETFLPTIVICYVLLMVGWARKKGLQTIPAKLITSFRNDWGNRATRRLLVVTSLLVVLLTGLFVERYGQNYILYRKTTPACNQVHSEAECMQSSIYRRNTGQRKEYLAYLQNGGQPSMSFVQFVFKWWRLIYERTYFFRGMATTNPTWQARIVASVTAPILLALAIVGWRKIAWNDAEKALLAITFSYIVLVFFYNYNAYRYYGYPFAIQGRYLLPILPFFYFFVLKGMLSAYHLLSSRAKNMALVVLSILLFVNILFHLPLMIYRHKGELLNSPEAFIPSVIANFIS